MPPDVPPETWFNHEKLDAYQSSLEFVGWSAPWLQGLQPAISARDHLLRASESISRNIVRANAKPKGPDRAQTFDISYGSALECAACLDVLACWRLIEPGRVLEGKTLLDRVVATVIGLRGAEGMQAREASAPYGASDDAGSQFIFAHEKLQVFQSALRFVSWSAALLQSEPVGMTRGRDLDRQCTSIVLNIAEGNGKFSVTDRIRFLEIAQASGLQAATSLDLMLTRSTISPATAAQGKCHLEEIVSMLLALSSSLS
ncbi:MAG: four helix bundle protein [Verrucomicrobia bacterium]|nr:four helix bundle protein [Verrucomicrobiota bacterium]MDA1085910.1 four helix bundle protein [Verrucomicrobiota bacterium]